MIASVIEQYKQLESVPGMKWSPQQRLLLASLLVDRTPSELDTFQELTRAYEQKFSRFSSAYKLRYVIPAFLCRMGMSAEETALSYFQAYEEVKAQKVASSLPHFEAVVALLLTLQGQNTHTYTFPEHITRLKDAYKQWRGLHSWLTNQSILPVLAWATHSPTDVKQLVSDAEHRYQQLRQANLKQSMKTMQYAWLLTAKGLAASSAGPTFQQYKDLFRQSKIRDTTSAIHLLTLHELSPQQTVPAVLQRLEQLKAESSFKFLPNTLLLRVATQTYLRERHAQTVQEQAALQVGLQDNQHDLSLISDAMDASLLTAVIIASDSSSAAAGGDGSDGGGSGCSSGCGGGCGGGS